MKIAAGNEEFGSGMTIQLISDVLIKSKKDRRYKYYKKVDKKYIMSKSPSLKYFASVLWFSSDKTRPLIISIKTDDALVTCVYHQRIFEHYIDKSITLEKYISKLKDIYIVAGSFILYSNYEFQIPDRDVSYFVFDEKLVKRLSKISISPAQLAAVAIMTVIALFMVTITYKEIVSSKKRLTIKQKEETYEEAYYSFLKEQLASSVKRINKFLSIKLDPYERVLAIDRDNIIVESLVYKPSYNQEGNTYRKTYNISELSDGSTVDMPNIPKVESCPNVISDKFVVKEYRVEKLRSDRPYQYREAVIVAKGLNYDEVLKMLREALTHCVAIKEIKYSRERGFDIEASKYSEY